MKRICALVALATSIAFAQQTPNLKLNLPPTGQQNWGPSVNRNFTVIDTAMGALQNAYQGPWVSTTTYSQGQIVTFGNSAYMSLVIGNVNHQPDVSPTQWGILSAAGSNVPAPGTTGNAPVSNGSIYTSQIVLLSAARAVANGVASLDSTAHVPFTQIVPTSTPADQLFGTTAAGTGSFISVPNCPNDGAHSVTYSTASHTFACASISGGATIPGTVHQIITAGTTAGTAAASNATLDAPGNTVNKSFNGTPRPDLFVSSVGVFDGIQQALHNPGTAVIADQGYAPNEAPNWTDFRNTGFFVANTFNIPRPHGPSGVWAYNTILLDRRFSSTGVNYSGQFEFNPIPDPVFGGTRLDEILIDDNPVGRNNAVGYQNHQYYMRRPCCGAFQYSGNQSQFNPNLWFFSDQTQGISTVHNILASKPSTGDFQIRNVTAHPDGGCVEASCEGATMDRLELLTDNDAFSGTIINSVTTGSTVISTSLLSGSTDPGEGKRLVNMTLASAPLKMTALTIPNFPTPGTWTFEGTPFTVDNSCILTTGVFSVPNLVKGGTTSTPITMNSCTATLPTTAVSGFTACVADVLGGMESAVVTVGGTTTATLALHSNHLAGATIMFGPGTCMSGEAVANRLATSGPGYHNFIDVIGASANNVLLYADRFAGGWTAGPNGFFSLQSLQSGATLSRDGSGNVTATLSAPNWSFNFNWSGGVRIVVDSAGTSNFNGTFVVNQTDFETLTWNDGTSGAGGSTTISQPAFILSRAGQPSNQIILYPSALVVQATNPSTFVNDGTVVIHPNQIAWAPGQTVVEGPVDSNLIQMFGNALLETPSTPSLSANQGIWESFTALNPCDQCDLHKVGFVAEAPGITGYVGGGGSRRILGGYNNYIGDPISHYLNMLEAPDNSGFVTGIVTCGIRHCSDPGAFLPFDVIIARDHYTGVQTGQYKSQFTFHNLNWAYFVQDNTNGNINVTTMSPTQSQYEIQDPATNQTSNFIQTPLLFQFHGGILPAPSQFDAGSTVNSSLICSVALGCDPNGTAGGDLSGSYPNPTVSKLNGVAAASIPTTGTPTLGQTACIKATGPPVVIGTCSTVVGSTGACTCI